MITLGIIILLIVVGGWVFMQTASFGQLPKDKRLARIQKSPNFKDGQFQNLSPTPDLAEGVSYYAVMKEFMFQKSKRNTPVDSLPSQKTDLKALQPEESVLVWFGHSSYFIQVDGKRILIDPVFSGAASPIKATTRSYMGSDVYSVDDFPAIDYLFISHDHWDHLDYETIIQLKPKVKKVITGLGVGAHFERWGYDTSKVLETDWYDVSVLDEAFKVTTTPARHFSGRGFSRNKSLWASFVLQTPSMKLYIGGDSGYDSHFKDIGQKYGPFDLALLECGQYDKSWKYIHMMPEEVVQATKDLGAYRLMPVHWSKFSLGNHAWDDPILRVTAAAKEQGVSICTPMIGEKLSLKDSIKHSPWWSGLN